MIPRQLGSSSAGDRAGGIADPAGRWYGKRQEPVIHTTGILLPRQGDYCSSAAGGVAGGFATAVPGCPDHDGLVVRRGRRRGKGYGAGGADHTSDVRVNRNQGVPLLHQLASGLVVVGLSSRE